MAIMGVIITHLVLLQNGTDGVNNDPSPVVQFMFSGLIMFMVVSGYFYKPGKTYLENVKARAIPFFVIFLVASVLMTVIMYVYLLALGYDLSSYDFGYVMSYSVLGTGCGLDLNSQAFIDACAIPAPYQVTIQMYYLGLLALGYLIFYAVVDRVISDWRKAVATIIILFFVTSAYLYFIHIQTPFYVHLAPMVAGFLLVGALMAKFKLAYRLENGLRKKEFWIAFAISIVVAAVCLVCFPANTDLTKSQLGDYGIFSIFTFAATSLSCGVVQLFLAAIFVKIPGWSHLFIAMGKDVLYLYLLHPLVAKMLVAPFVVLDTQHHIPLPFDQALILAFVTIAIIMVLAYVYKRLRNRCSEGPRGMAPASI
jgi:fucose 4-O-acetylase-like acetyltransferase